jgi:hypothetical protein
MAARLRPYLVLVLLWAVYFHPLVVHPGGVLYADYSDFLAEHLPAKLFLNREWRESGELPRWNPYHFCGSPFIHDVQVGAFYPPYAVTYLVPESALGAALSWVIALHVLAAGFFTFVYARSRGLGELGALVAAVGFMLSAKWMTHLLLAGHTVTVGLAWLPLVLLGLEHAIRTGRMWPAVGAGVAFALLLLGTHPQWALYAGVFAAAWALAAALEAAGYLGGAGERGRDRTRRAVVRWLACGLGAVVVAVALAAVQILPALEAAGQSTRTAGLKSTESLKAGLAALFGLVGPSVAYDPPPTWEIRGLFGVSWLAAALAAPVLVRGRTRHDAGVFLGLLVFSFGGAVLVEWLPGFDLFRNPARMLLVAAFPLALLAGTATDALVRCGWDAGGRRVVRRFFLGVVLFAVLPSLLCVGVMVQREPGRPVWGLFVAYWAVVVATLPVVVWLCLPGHSGAARLRTRCWVVVLLAELVAPVATLPGVRPQAAIYPRSGIVGFLSERAKPGEWRVMDWDTGGGIADKLAVLGVGSPEALVYRLETPRGYNPLDVRHYREFIGYIAGLGAEVRGLDDVAQPILPNFRVANRGPFDLLNVRYFVCDKDAMWTPLDQTTWRPLARELSPPLVPAIPPNPPPGLPESGVFENLSVRPRAFVVPEARPMPAGHEAAALQTCDFSRTVLLTTDAIPACEPVGPSTTATVTEYRPNRVVIRIGGGGGGYLVLSDVWFPGWVCRIDGREVPVYRANHAFRAVALPAGATEAVFAFEPRSYPIGWWVSCGMLIGLTLLGGGRLLLGFRSRIT